MKKFFFCFLSLFFPLLSLQADLCQGPRYQLNFPYSENWSLQEEASGPDYLFQGWIAQDQEHFVMIESHLQNPDNMMEVEQVYHDFMGSPLEEESDDDDISVTIFKATDEEVVILYANSVIVRFCVTEQAYHSLSYVSCEALPVETLQQWLTILMEAVYSPL